MTHRVLLISGVPASGKTHFGCWLERTHFYCHLDVEKPSKLEGNGLRREWDQCFLHHDARPFFQKLRVLGKPVVIDWGFPIHCLPIVELFKSTGMSLWWFDADHKRARDIFIKRGDVLVEAFEAQINSIRTNWKSIEGTFGTHIIRTLEEDGTCLAPETILAKIEEAFL